jgi:glycerophosphoryl diester phosphodiesterase
VNILGEFMISGHRGAAALAPENTLSGFKKALQSGIKWIEVDAQLSADNTPIMFHDETVNRCTNGEGSVADLTLEQLQALDAGSWFSNEFSGEKIPTLEQALVFFLKNDLIMNLEMKIHHQHQVQPLVEKVAEVLTQVNFPSEKLILSSLSKSALEHCHQIMPNIRRGYVTKQNPLPILEKLKSMNLYSVHVHCEILNQEMAQKISQSGFKLATFTLNDPQQASKFRSWGVDMIITDKPDIFDQE